MKNFFYYNPTRIAFGSGTISHISKWIDPGEKVLMLSGGGSIKKNGVYDQVMRALDRYSVTEFWGITPNPEYGTCLEAVEEARRNNVDFLLSVGGGSVLDATKFIAVAVRYDPERDPWEVMEGGEDVRSAVPLGCVLTLPATGSEVNGNAVISRREKNQKLAFSSPLTMPRFSILDPESTLTLSARQTANGIVDAFVHVIEQYATYDVGTPLQDRQSEAILQTLIEQGPRVISDPQDIEARAHIMWCASNALNGLISCGVVQDWATHMIGHELTVLHGLDHAQTLAIVLPSLLRHQKRQKAGKLAQFGRRVWGLSGPDDEVIDRAIDKTEAFFRSVGTGTRLRDYGIRAEDCLIAARRLIERVGPIGEQKDIGLQEVETILRASA